MDLWSRGLGKRVLSLSLAENESLDASDGALVIKGVMRAPTFWDYEVTLDEDDLVEFLELLQRRESLRLLSTGGRRRAFLRAALPAAAAFAMRTLRLLLRRAPRATQREEPAQIPTEEDSADVGA